MTGVVATRKDFNVSESYGSCLKSLTPVTDHGYKIAISAELITNQAFPEQSVEQSVSRL